MSERIAIVVLNWNGMSDTAECLDSLSKQTYNNYHIILIDNGSTEPNTPAFLKDTKDTYGSLITIIESPVNTGFAGGVNIGIRHALDHNFDYVALFNNDATADKDWLSHLVNAAVEYKSGITTGLLLHHDGKTIDTSGDSLSIWGLPFPRDRNKPTADTSDSGYVFSGCGGASLYSIKMLRQIGLFDDKFFAYYEDTDMSFRAHLYGWRVYYTSKAVAYHKRGATSDKIPGFTTYQTFKNLPMFFIKNVPLKLLWRVGIRFWFAYYAILGNAILQKRGLPALKGFFASVYLTLTHALPARLKNQKNTTKQTPDEIANLIYYDLPPDQTGLRKLRSLILG